MAKFKVGDRVRMVDADYRYAAKGEMGTVADNDEFCPDVDWDGSGCRYSAAHTRLEMVRPAAPQAVTADPLAILIACGIITQAQADAARALVTP